MRPNEPMPEKATALVFLKGPRRGMESIACVIIAEEWPFFLGRGKWLVDLRVLRVAGLMSR